MGTTGNAAWAEGVGAATSEPADALKSLGFSLNEIPASDEINWQFRNLGRSVIRRFAAAENLIAAQRAGLAAPDSYEDVGLVLPNLGSPPVPLWSVMWSKDVDLEEVEMVVDGDLIWTTFGGGVLNKLRCRSRTTGNVVLDQPAGNFHYPYLATAGGNVYALDIAAGVPQLLAYDRGTLAQLYTIALPGVETARAIVADGKYVAVASGNFMRLYQDTGAALALIGSYDHAAAVNTVVMDGRYIVFGGVGDGAPPSKQIRVVDYALTLIQELSRTGDPAVNRLAFDGELLAFAGDDDAGDDIGLFRFLSTAGMDWTVSGAANDVLLMDGSLFDANTSGIGRWYVVDGVQTQGYVWPHVGFTNVYKLGHDYDGFFALGEKSAANNCIKRFCIQNTPRLYSVVPQSAVLGGAYAGPVHALIRPADQRPR